MINVRVPAGRRVLLAAAGLTIAVGIGGASPVAAAEPSPGPSSSASPTVSPSPSPVPRFMLAWQGPREILAGQSGQASLRVRALDATALDARLTVSATKGAAVTVTCVKNARGVCKLGDLGTSPVTVAMTLRAARKPATKKAVFTVTVVARGTAVVSERFTASIKVPAPSGRPSSSPSSKPRPSQNVPAPQTPPAPSTNGRQTSPASVSPPSTPPAVAPLPQIASDPTPIAGGPTSAPQLVLRSADTEPGDPAAAAAQSMWLTVLLVAAGVALMRTVRLSRRPRTAAATAHRRRSSGIPTRRSLGFSRRERTRFSRAAKDGGRRP
ncbi:hypothetical protein [Actinomadura kijaniata]|uniref:hypothetical protein n=1 Tax=Actinomadura kijaniata TaxID=46161 RepID=UPI000AD2A089|nr:hypothetical protein [Actinomadura kijaniata]